MSIITVGIEFARTVFPVDGVDEAGKPVLVKPKVPRDQLVALSPIAAVRYRHRKMQRRCR